MRNSSRAPYYLELIEDSSSKELPFNTLSLRSQIFAEKFQQNNPNCTKWGNTNWDFYNQIAKMASWGILQHIDATDKLGFERDITRMKMENLLGYKGIQEAYTIAVNGALLAGHVEGNPGFKRGHSILLRKVANNKESLFYDTITPEFETRLVNLAFWEELPNLSPNLDFGAAYNIVEEILSQKSHLLSPNFASKGVGILKREFFPRSYNFNLTWGHEEGISGLSKRALRAYGKFMEELDKSGTDREVMRCLVEPYIYSVKLNNYGEGILSPNERENILSKPVFKKYNQKSVAA